MMFPISVMLFLSIFFTICLNTFGQIGSDEALGCNDDYARTLITQQADSQNTSNDREKRIKILTTTGDFLWRYEEDTARNHLAEAFDLARQQYIYDQRPKEIEKTQKLQLLKIPIDFRFEVLKVLAKNDKQWAIELAEELIAESEKKRKEGSRDKDDELMGLLNLANSQLEHNPAFSMVLYRRAMKYPPNMHWVFINYLVAKQNRPLGDSLYRTLIQAYSTERPINLLYLSAFPFGKRFPIGRGSSAAEGFIPNVQLQKLFLVTFLRRVDAFTLNPQDFSTAASKTELSENAQVYSALKELQPDISSQHPEMLPLFSTVFSRSLALMTQADKDALETREKDRESVGKRFEERLEELEKASEEGKLTDPMILQLAVFYNLNEDQILSLEPWLDKIKNKDAQLQAKNYLYFGLAQLYIKSSNTERATEITEKIRNRQFQALAYFFIVEEMLKGKMSPPYALEILNRASRMARDIENSPGKAQMLLGLVEMYAKIDTPLALGELTQAVTVINQLKNDDLLSSSAVIKIETEEYQYSAGFRIPGNNLETIFENIAKKDFELALANAKSLNDPYFRTLATIAIAKNCIGKKPREAAAN